MSLSCIEQEILSDLWHYWFWYYREHNKTIEEAVKLADEKTK